MKIFICMLITYVCIVFAYGDIPEIWFSFDTPQGMYRLDKDNNVCYMSMIQSVSLDGKLMGSEWIPVDFKSQRCRREQDLFSDRVDKLIRDNLPRIKELMETKKR